MSSVSNYAHRILLAEELAKLGCKWPILHELLGIRISDAQKMVYDKLSDSTTMSRLEKGLFWWKAPGECNLRMAHANFIYRIFEGYHSSPSYTQRILDTYKTYRAIVKIPVINNFNRVYYLLNSVKQSKGFKFRTCTSCKNEYIAIVLLDTKLCPACERDQYMICVDCSEVLKNPYVPGRNGNKKRRCEPCGLIIRKKRRKLKRNQSRMYVKEYTLL